MINLINYDSFNLDELVWHQGSWTTEHGPDNIIYAVLRSSTNCFDYIRTYPNAHDLINSKFFSLCFYPYL